METRKDQILDGMAVTDVEGKHVGKVVRYDVRLGYFETQGTFSGARFVPFSAIEAIGPTGAQLNVTKSFVTDFYKHSPAVKPKVTPEGRLEGGTVDSGYGDARSVALDAAAVNQLREKIGIGTSVFDADDKKLGKIDAYDASTGYMRIEKAGPSAKDIFLPVTSVRFLDDRGVHLYDTTETIAMRFTRLPDIARQYFAA